MYSDIESFKRSIGGGPYVCMVKREEQIYYIMELYRYPVINHFDDRVYNFL